MKRTVPHVMLVLVVIACIVSAAASGVAAGGSEQGEAAGSAVSAEPSGDQARDALAEPEEVTQPAPSQVERGGLLVGAGKHEVEYRLSSAHFSTNTIFIEGIAILPVIVVGEISVERIRRNVLIGSWAYRVGLRDNVQVELRVPYRYQHDRSAMPEATPPRESVQDDRGLGDIAAAIYHQLPKRYGGHDLIVGLEVKSRTGRDIFETTRLVAAGDEQMVVQDGLPMGTGFWSAKTVVSGVRVSDPAALFWHMGYTKSLARDDVTVYRSDPATETIIAEQVKVTPGATFEYGFGLGYGLNPDFSLSAQFQQAYTQSTQIAGPTTSGRVSGSTVNAASFRLGGVWRTGPASTTDLSVSLGLSEDAPDFVVELRKVIGS